MNYDFNDAKIRRTIATAAEASQHAGYTFQYDWNVEAASLKSFFKGIAASHFDLA